MFAPQKLSHLASDTGEGAMEKTRLAPGLTEKLGKSREEVGHIQAGPSTWLGQALVSGTLGRCQWACRAGAQVV